jgi:drug/metabolite transporter (DMT)-like permease
LGTERLRTITVTFLIPGFAVAWGAMFLGETLTWQMVLGCGVILLGTALATGVLRPSWPARKGSDRTQAVK